MWSGLCLSLSVCSDRGPAHAGSSLVQAAGHIKDMTHRSPGRTSMTQLSKTARGRGGQPGAVMRSNSSASWRRQCCLSRSTLKRSATSTSLHRCSACHIRHSFRLHPCRTAIVLELRVYCRCSEPLWAAMLHQLCKQSAAAKPRAGWYPSCMTFPMNQLTCRALRPPSSPPCAEHAWLSRPGSRPLQPTAEGLTCATGLSFTQSRICHAGNKPL